MLALGLAIATLGGAYATNVYLNEAANRAQTTLRLAVAALRGHMSRYESLPPLIAENEGVKALVRDPDNAALREDINRYLKSVNTLLESSDIYVMLPDGMTIAASNFDISPTFVGENFSYRPYFYEAMAGERARFFALGTTSLKRGYYFSSPIRIGDAIAGVLVFKVDLDAIENSWAGGDHEIIVSDPEGIIFMTGRRDWLFTGLLPLTPERRARTGETRRYANAVLRDLPVLREARDSGQELMTIGQTGEAREYLVLADDMPEAGWTVKVLLETGSARAQAGTTVLAALLLLGLAGMAIVSLVQRRARLAERMQLQQEARETLERRVAERTAALASVNHQLEREVAERTATEIELRKTQSDLVQAGKLAALGQMSAALSHEFNQPLSAVKTYADNALVLLDRGRAADAGENVSRISALADRMASISRHLRNFARKPNEKLGPVALEGVIEATLEIVAGRIGSAGAQIEQSVEPGLFVRAGSVRLQQVLVNIIGNAADAVEDGPDRRIELSARRAGDTVEIAVRDHGPGIDKAVIGRIFDPFFTTKGVGKGLGLGLSISYNIIKDFDGALAARNHPDGGAEFIVTLASASSSLVEAAE
ncbi:sensor histidine kinase [Arsenicitalea aurantiaca]|nr:ATP-binding protein [Arsenicitalea aurantiaca]